MSSPICLFFALLLIAAVVVEVRSLESTISGEVESVRDEASSGGVIHRKKRYLDFIPLSRMFFRANIKDNVQNSTNFWVQAYGYKANYVIENRRRTKRSEVYDTLSELISQHGIDGRACILKSFCEANRMVTPNSGLIFKLFKMMFSAPPTSSGSHSLPEGDDELFPYLKSDNCDELNEHCPLSLLNISQYTDD